MLPDDVREVLIDCLHVGANDDTTFALMRTQLADVVNKHPKPSDIWVRLASKLDRLFIDKQEQYERTKMLIKIINERI